MIPDLSGRLRAIYKYGMDPKLFKQRLEEFAELKQMKVPRAAGRAEATQPEVIEREGKTFTIELHDNPTIGWGIKKLKPHVAVCEDCHNVVENRQVDSKRYDSPVDHWRKHCKPCGMIRNPYTNVFDVTVKHSHHTFACFYKGMPQPYAEECEQEEPSHLKPHFKKPAK